MDIKEELVSALGRWTAKLADPKIGGQFQGFQKTLQFHFTDQAFRMIMAFRDGTCEIREGSVPQPDIEITTTAGTILGIANGEIHPMKAFLSRRLRAKGSTADMLKVQLLMRNG